MAHVIMGIVVIGIVLGALVCLVGLVQPIRHQFLQLSNPPLCRLLGATQTQPLIRFHLRVRRLQRQLLLVETQEQPVMLTAVLAQPVVLGRRGGGHQIIQNVVLSAAPLTGVSIAGGVVRETA